MRIRLPFDWFHAHTVKAYAITAILLRASISPGLMMKGPFMSTAPNSDNMSSFPTVFEKWSRREFVRTAGVTTAASLLAPRIVQAKPKAAGEKATQSEPEALVKKLYESLTPQQREKVCFDWNYKDKRGLLRQHVAGNWQITEQLIVSDFYTKDQQELIEAIYYNMHNPEWKDRLKKRLNDDSDGFGTDQAIAIFGQPGSGKFEFVFSGRHVTMRCDGDSNDHFAFGGPIFYGHDPDGTLEEEADHPGNVYWDQALKANALYKMLDGKQRKAAMVVKRPHESHVHFRKSADQIPGIRISEMSQDQQSHMGEVLNSLTDPFRKTDQAEISTCLAAQGGLENCRLTFYKEGDIGNDQVWDNWRLEGPAFVWHYRGEPHVHVWVNIADNASAQISTG